MCTQGFANPTTDCSTCDPIADYQALRALYLSTNGDGWFNKVKWPDEALFNSNPTTPPTGFENLDDWQWVTTNADGCVEKLLLFANKLDGTIPVEIGNLTHLKILRLELNSLLTGSIPNSIGNLTDLRIFWAFNDNLNGNVPIDIANLSQLKELRLGGNELTGAIPPLLGDLTDLKILHLGSNNLSGNIPQQLGNLTNLQQLFLHRNQLTGEIPAQFSNLSALQYLGLNSNDLSGCYDPSLSVLCIQLGPASTNARISDGNTFDAAWEDFCGQGQGECVIDPPTNPCDSILTAYSSAPDSLGYCCFDIYIENTVSDYFTNIVFKPFNGTFGSWQLNDPSAWNVPFSAPNVISMEALPGPFIPTGNHKPITFCLDNYTNPPQEVAVEWVASDGTRCSDILVFDCAPPPVPCPTVDAVVNHNGGCCYQMTLNNTNVATPIYEIQIDIIGQPGISFDANSVFPTSNTVVSQKQIKVDNNGSAFPSNTLPLVNFCLNNSGTTPVTSQSFEIKYFDINGKVIDCTQQITEGCELIPCTPDWYEDPLCTGCTGRVEVIEYQGEKYIIFWGDPYCSDALTIVYNYCDGTEFCKEHGFAGYTECSSLMPDLIKNHTVIEVLWSKDTDCDTNDCCADPCEFFDRVNAPILTNAPHADGCKLGITTVAFTDCDQVTIDWGDGIIEGPFSFGNVAVSHVYAAPGNYEVIMYIKEIGADGKACWEGVSRIEVKADCEEERTEEPQEVVFQNYPNPFTDQTMIEFTLTKDAPVTLLIFDSMGRQIATLLDNESTITGTHQVTFDGTDYPTGVYYYTIQAGEFFGTQKMTFIK